MSQSNDKLDLGWGNPYFLLEVLNKEVTSIRLKPQNYMDVVYEDDMGNEKLLKYCKDITESLTGNKYKHYLITNGATQAINTVMRVWQFERELAYCVTGELGYPFYPGIVEKNGLWHKTLDINNHEIDLEDEMVLIDSPSNPLGDQISDTVYIKDRENVVWDAVYHSPIYNANMQAMPNHEVYINSFSKFLGVTGARVGWLATNDSHDYSRFKNESLYENATVSQPGQKLVLDTLNSLDIRSFMDKGRRSLDRNREILHGISGLLGADVQEVGMFYCAEVDQKMVDLFEKANIGCVVFDLKDRLLLRLNMGQTSDILQKAVKRLNKIDRGK